MRNREGAYIWYELLSHDPDAAQDFYATVVGWTFARPPGGLERNYHIFSAPDVGVGGMMKIPDGAQMPPRWLDYVGVNDVDSSAQMLKGLGGSILNGPTEVPAGDWVIQAKDPQGAFIGFTGSRGV